MSDYERELRRAETRGYQRGYRAASEARWPWHKPIVPPHEITAKFMTAAQRLRDEADVYCACLDQDDELVTEHLGPAIDAIDEALADLVKWLAQPESISG